jgi:diguanylate cyclase (GGDEF)-like protein
VLSNETTPMGLTDRPARLGFWLIAVCSSAVGAGVWALVPSEQAGNSVLVAGLSMLVAAGLRLAPPADPGAWRHLLFPVVLFVELAALSLINPLAGQPFLPMITLAFIYAGLACAPHQSWWLLPPAAATWLLAYDVPNLGPTPALFIRLPIGMVVWVLVAELLARHVSRVRRHTDLLSERANTDPLTGLSNRRAMPQLLGNARAGDALVMLDVDHFRRINERLGHAGGDEVLRRLGSVIRSGLRRPDHAVRYGGEEILLLLPGVMTPERTDAALHRLTEIWTVAARGLGPDHPVTFSVGAAILRDLESPGEAVQAADALLYEAKQAGRNCWRIRQPDPAESLDGAAV